MWAIFQESGNSPVVVHFLKSLDNHSDTMQLAICFEKHINTLKKAFSYLLLLLIAL